MAESGKLSGQLPDRAARDARGTDNLLRVQLVPTIDSVRGHWPKWLLLLSLNALLIGWILLSPATGLALRLPAAVANLLATLTALAWCVPITFRLWRFTRTPVWHDPTRLSASAISLAFICLAGAQAAASYYEILGGRPTFPSWADAGYLLAYPLMIAGVLMLPGRRLTHIQRGRAVMDSVMTLAATATFSWYFLLGPVLLSAFDTATGKFLAAAYPVGDLLLLFCLLLTVARTRGATPEPGMLPLCLGLLVIVVTDVVFGYQVLHASYVAGSLLDAGWPLGFMLVALGARLLLTAERAPAEASAPKREEAAASGVETMLPYALVPMVGALVLGTLHEPSGPLLIGVYVGSALIVVLVVLRQVLTIRQNARLYAEVSGAYAQLEQSHRSLEAANATLAHTEERFRAAAESASDLIYEVDFDSGGVEWFGDIDRHLAVPAGAFARTRKAWEDIIHPEDRARVLRAFEAHAETGERFEFEYRVQTGDGQYRYWTDRGRVTHRDGHAPRRAVGAVSDITERKHADSLERERAGLRQAVSAMEGVLGVVGHELRTPLAGLRAMSEFLLTDGATGSRECEQMLSGINEEVVRMSETVNDLLEAARLNSGLAKWKWSTFGLRQMCEEAIDPIRPLVDEKTVRLECDVDADLTMQGDADAVRRLVLNLLSNARKFTKQGFIGVSARVTIDEGRRWVQFLVSDSGAGIPPEIRDRLGEAFALNAGMVGANHVSGTGLGLAICKGIAAAHGGSLSVLSQVGEGTTVVARLRADLEGPMTLQGKSAVTGAASLTAAASPCGPCAN